MNVYYFLQLYLTKLDDHKFVSVWENRFMNKLMNFISILFVIFIVLVVGFGFFINAISSFLLAIVMMGLFSMILGYYMIVHLIQFLALNNQRYVNIMTGQSTSNINYDNVVN